MKALSSDTRGFDLFAGSVTFAADAFETAAGAAVLFGASEEDAAAATATLTAIQSISNGVKGIANELTTRGTAANKLFAFAQLQVKTAFDVTATSAARLRAALITIGIGALIVGVGLLIANFGKLKEFFQGNAREAQRFAESQKRLAEYNKEVSDSVAKESSELKILKSKIEDTNLPMNVRIANVKDLQELYPQYFKDLKQEDLLNGNVANAYDLAAQAILRKAKAISASKKVEELSSQELNIDKEGIDDLIKTNKAVLNATKRTKTVGKAEREEVVKTRQEVQAEIIKGFKDRQEIRDKDKKAIASEQDFYINTIKNNTDLTKEQRERQLKDAKDAKDKADKIDKDSAKKSLNAGKKSKSVKEDVDAVYEVLILDKKRRIALAESIASDEEAGYLERLTYLTDFLRLSQQLLDLQNEHELRKKGLTKNEKIVIDAKYEDERIKLSEDGGKRLEEIRKTQHKTEIKLSDELRKNIAGGLQASIDYEDEERQKAF
ncbi:MAG: hypothetical protein IPJ81_18005 [Chitinophagaceae bacterium]|nr:hypothetical protein [Chitinophagaceae bacterium]